MRQSWIVMLMLSVSGLVSMQVSAEADNHVTASNLVSVLDDYYAEVNKQLDKRLNRTRQPFVSQIDEAEKVSRRREVSAPKQKSNTLSGVYSEELRRPLNLSSGSIDGLPVLSIKGFLENDGHRAVLLEIEGQGVLMVREGDKVGLQQMTDAGSVLRVVEINELNLTLRADASGKEFVVQ